MASRSAPARQLGIEVVDALGAIVRRERARGEVVRDARVVAAEVAVDLRSAVTPDVVGGPDARRPVVLQLEVVDDRAGQLLLLVAEAGVNRQVVAGLPRILDEEGLITLRRRRAGREVGARHAVDLPKLMSFNTVIRAGRGLAAVRRQEGRAVRW